MFTGEHDAFAIRIEGRRVNLIECDAGIWEVTSLGCAELEVPALVGRGESLQDALEGLARAWRELQRRCP